MTVRQAMTFSEVEISKIEALIEDDTRVLEQKFDGTRAMCVIKKSKGDDGLAFDFLARNGGPLKHTAAMQWFAGIERAMQNELPWSHFEIVLDGEIMIDSGAFLLFDMPYCQVEGVVITSPEDPYYERRASLAGLAVDFYSPVQVGQIARTAAEKRALFDLVTASNGEGVMVKTLDSPYEPGKRVKHSVKVKFVKTADVFVTKSTRGRNEAGRETGSFSFSVFNERGLPKRMGSCSAIGKPEVNVGDVIEVAYLYRAGDGLLVQPRMRSVRTDKVPNDCNIDQFPEYSKKVL